MNAKFCSMLFLVMFGLIVVNAQSGGPYEIKQSSVAGGGSTLLAGGPYTAHSTIGQKQGGNLSGGIFSTVSGFLVPRVTGDVNGDFCVDDADLLAVLFVLAKAAFYLKT